MHGLNINWVDILVVAVIVISTLIAVLRGFVRETLSILAWSAAIAAAFYFGPAATRWLRHYISTPFAAPLLAYIGIFVVMLIPFSIASHRLSQMVRNSAIGMLDRGLGIPFGILRGLVLVGVAYLAVCFVMPFRAQPPWLTHARLLPILQYSSKAVSSIIPDLRHAAFIDDDEAADAAEPPSAPAEHNAQKIYRAADRRALDHLIETTSASGNGRQ
ncbi:MAG TPA: CvpA family protein [Rhizomicrobium sp.]|jgi:membrane protein required for colicin V production|nr:CvpA family protein [Rhizomicrobium sp.]